MINKPHKHIGIAIIINDNNEILIDQRLPKGEMASYWEFPGGKVEEGETVEDCIIREMKEELGVTVRCDRTFLDLNYDYEKFTVTLSNYICRIVEGIPQPIECEKILWIKPQELDNFEFPTANREIIQLLQKELM